MECSYYILLFSKSFLTPELTKIPFSHLKLKSFDLIWNLCWFSPLLCPTYRAEQVAMDDLGGIPIAPMDGVGTEQDGAGAAAK
jgi:hypothetical protein